MKVCEELFKKDEYSFYISSHREIGKVRLPYSMITNKNNATNTKQLERLLALNQLLNIAKYYNKLHPEQNNAPYCIWFVNKEYKSGQYYLEGELFGIIALFNREEDAQAVIGNPNFREILDTVYK